METTLGTARMLAGLGVATFPLRPRDKVPAIAEWQKCEVDAGEEAAAYWLSHPDNNIAILCGAASGGLFAIDIDSPEEHANDGFMFLRKWESEHGELPETATSKTGSGGLHMLYRASKPVKTGANGDIGIDVRGEGGYIVAPPSIHPNGTPYEWECDPSEFGIAEADANVLAFLEAVRAGGEGGGEAQGKPRFELPKAIPQGMRDDTLFRYACSMQATGYADEHISLLVSIANEERCAPPLPKEEIDAKVKQALQYPKGHDINLDEAAALMRARAQSGVKLAVDSHGHPLKTIANCITVLENDPEVAGRFKYDLLGCCRTVALPLPWRAGEGQRPIRDADYAELAAWLESKYRLTTKQHAVDAALAVCERHSFNPVMDWLRSLQWDGVRRIGSALSILLGCPDTEYTRTVSSLIFLGGVARAVDAGCKFDYMPVLVGRQGTGKSTFVSKLAVRSEWYLDNLGSFDGDSAIEKLRGKWVCEVAELAAFKSRKGVEQIKAFISSKADTIRPKYGRETEDRKRRAILIGTTNDDSFLVDITGNRRFWPVEAGAVRPAISVFDADADAFIEQCWAEAFAMNGAAKIPLVVPDSVLEAAEAERERFAEEDPMVGAIGAFLDRVLADSDYNRKEVCSVQIGVEGLDYELEYVLNNKPLTNRIGAIMRESFADDWTKGEKPVKISFGRYGWQRYWKPANEAITGFYSKFDDI